MRAIIAICVLVVFSMGVVVADDFFGTITKIETKDGKTTISGKKGKKDDVKEFTLTVTKDVKVAKGKFNKDDKKFEAGDAIESGLKNDMFKEVSAEKGKSKGAWISTDKDDKVTSILVIGGGMKKKKDTN